MINHVTGEIQFTDGLCLSPDVVLSRERLVALGATSFGPDFHALHERESDRGRFSIRVGLDGSYRIRAVFLAHQHSSYKRKRPEDAERRAYHEYVIAHDLGGQREFSWGRVSRYLHPGNTTDYLYVFYTPELRVPSQLTGGGLQLAAYRDEPGKGPTALGRNGHAHHQASCQTEAQPNLAAERIVTFPSFRFRTGNTDPRRGHTNTNIHVGVTDILSCNDTRVVIKKGRQTP